MSFHSPVQPIPASIQPTTIGDKDLASSVAYPVPDEIQKSVEAKYRNGLDNGSEAMNGDDGLPIPLIDISPFLSPTSTPSTRQQTARALLSAFQHSGFLYLTHHPIPTSLISRTFADSAAFFELPQSLKDSLAWYSPEANRGYSGMGKEKTSQLDKEGVDAARETEGEDLKESFEIGREGEGEGRHNMWPKAGEVPADAKFDAERWRNNMLEFHDVCKELHVQIMRALAVGLGIEEGWFDEYTDRGDNTLRLLHYPPQSREVFKRKKGQVRAGAHSDYGSCTLLFQDDRGGLEVQGADGGWRAVKPIEGAIVVNAGDLLARWSNDVVKSTVHRVVEPPTKGSEEVHPARYSIAYFCNPNFDKFIEAIPGTLKEGEKSKYEGVNSGEYLVQRLSATY